MLDCCKKVIFSAYDSEKDRFRFTPAVWGIKESLQRIPGAVQREDFDFETKRTFKIWGFKNLKGLKIFDKFWNNNEVLKGLNQNITGKKQELLFQWTLL